MNAMSITSSVAAALACLAGTAAAQPTVVTEGRVVDGRGRPVHGATIAVEGGGASARTGPDGRFRIDAPLGASLTGEAAGLGIGLAIVDGAPLEIILTTAETVRIVGAAPVAAPGAAQLDRQELQRVPGAGGDLVRALTVMPGVVNLQFPVGFTGVAIRGSSPHDSRLLVDDFEVPLLFHDIGFRAILPAESIASLDYIPGRFDVSYGRATSGIVRIATRPGEAKRTMQAEVSVVDGGLLAQGPAGRDTRYMVGLRRSTIDAVLPWILPSGVDLSLTTVARDWDGQLRVDHTASSRWRLTLSGFAADDTFELFTSKSEDAQSKHIFSGTRFGRLTASARYRNGPWRATLALSGLYSRFRFEIGLHQRIALDVPSVTPRVEVTRSAPKVLGLANVVWRVGGEAQVSRWNVHDYAFPDDLREGEPNPVLDPEDTSTRFGGVV